LLRGRRRRLRQPDQHDETQRSKHQRDDL
jgi:hypothetical protein